MIYVVSKRQELFSPIEFKYITVEESLTLLNKCNIIQYDSETTGRDAHVCSILCVQFGSKKYDWQIVVDTSSVDIKLYKEVLESKYIVGQNLKFDLQFLYNYNIVPRKIYDTMIVEQVLNLGASRKPNAYNFISMSLNSIAQRRLGINIDKSTRGEIIWRGLDTKVIIYAAKDVEYLEDIMDIQIKECYKKKCVNAAQLECAFVPVIAYLEWSGIKLDTVKWKAKMDKDLKNLNDAKKALDDFVINHKDLQDFVYINHQGHLWDGFDLTPKCSINWASSDQVVKVAKILGFNTTVKDKKTGEDKDSVIEKHLKKQKGINDEFLRLYFGKGQEGDKDYFPGHQGMAKVVSSFGQGHLNSVNSNTGRIHTQYHQLGADTGRMSSGSTQNNNDLARLKGLPINPSSKQKKEGLGCPYPNMQQLPNNKETRSCFVSEEGNLWVSCDYSAMESRLGADIYQEKAMIDEFLYGSGDMHSLVAKMIFPELKDIAVKDIKRLKPKEREDAKPVEFSQQFGGTSFAIQNAMGCSLENAQEIEIAYAKGFPGIAKYKVYGSNFVVNNGYILLNPITGHKTYWIGWEEWKKRQASFNSDFWEEYRIYHKGTDDNVAKTVRWHFQEKSKWDRKALNSVTQGTGAIILKHSQIETFNWVVDNGYFGKILLCNLTHDEANWEYPKEIEVFPSILQKNMEESADIYCKSLPIPAEPEIGTYWKH